MGMNHQFCIFSPVVLPCYATLASSCLGSSILKPMQSTRSLAFGWDAASLILVSDPGPCLCWMPLLHVSGAGTASCLPCPVSLDQHGPQPQLLARGWASPPPPSAFLCLSFSLRLLRRLSQSCAFVSSCLYSLCSGGEVCAPVHSGLLTTHAHFSLFLFVFWCHPCHQVEN